MTKEKPVQLGRKVPSDLRGRRAPGESTDRAESRGLRGRRGTQESESVTAWLPWKPQRIFSLKQMGN